jgi:hypothetical protein
MLVAMAAAGANALAIEMFTYFGDGSRIGLPNLEVPIEAYPGIPLRSDRLRARRRAMRTGPDSAVRVGPGTPIGNGITIRSMPALPAAPSAEPIAPPPPATPAAEPGTSRPATGRPAAN